MCFSARLKPTLSCFSDPRKIVGVEVEQIKKKSGPIAFNWRKKLASVRVVHFLRTRRLKTKQHASSMRKLSLRAKSSEWTRKRQTCKASIYSTFFWDFCETTGFDGSDFTKISMTNDRVVRYNFCSYTRSLSQKHASKNSKISSFSII